MNKYYVPLYHKSTS